MPLKKGQKRYAIYFHNKKDKSITGVRIVDAYSIKQAEFLFKKFIDRQNEVKIDKTQIAR